MQVIARFIVSAPLLLALAGCANSAPPKAAAPPIAATDGPPSTSLESLTDPASKSPVFLPLNDPAKDDLARQAEQAAINLERLLASGVLNRSAPEPEPAPDFNLADAVATTTVAAELTPEPEPEPVAPEPAPEPFDPLLDLARRNAKLLREPIEGKPRIPDAVALASIEWLEPGILADLESPTNHLGTRLSPEDRQALIAARDNILASPGATHEALAKTLAKLAPPPVLKISRATLCTRVSGFGSFDPYRSTTFVRGQAIRAIVYVELDGFTARPARASDPVQSGVPLSDQLSVDLAQSLTLYQDPSGLLSWHRPAKPVIETSRNKRRDFYLIQQIELPATLSIGRYNLKVTVKDRTTSAEAEAIIPITIVADRSAVK